MDKITRRKFVQMAGAVTAGMMLPGLAGLASGCAAEPVNGEKGNAAATKIKVEASTGTKAKVYFTSKIDAEHLVELYRQVSWDISGRTAIKLHTGEPNGPNILPRDMVAAFQKEVPNSTIIETNTAYGGGRGTTQYHRETLQINGWTFSPIDIIDADGDVNFPVHGGLHLQEVAVGAHLTDYDSLVVLTHFKGHTMGGFGGSLKNIAIGCASGKTGKLQVHGVTDYGKWVTGGLFMELMADSGKAICDHFGKQITFLNVLRRMSVDCDCVGVGAAEPTIPDIGILASTDILAIDQASVDLIYNMDNTNKKDLIERIESREGLRQLTAMKELGMGKDQYELISID